ncbi:HAD family hydrolase [Paenibacillus ferrarius]|uniref:HAD family hydrolase n=1 Tax=Paenibacillus ferrarius TaxID=1469647 RepID=UPI003D2ABCE5
MIKVLLFDWGDTLMFDFKDQIGTMAYWEHVEIIPYIDEALFHLHNKYKCAVASNAGDSNIVQLRMALERVHINHFFDDFFISSELGVVKPNPEFYLSIIKRLGVRPDECIMIGNDYCKDIVPAKSVGLKTIWYTSELMSGDNLSADVIVNSMDKLIDAVDKVNSMNK